MKHLTPQAAALLALLAGAGLGWALIAGAVPLLLLAATILRGLHRAQQNPQ